MRNAIPKDVIITDWHYGNFKPGKYISVDVLQKAGFDILGSTAYFPQNIIWFASALKQKKSLGYLHTTWAGFSFDQAGFDSLYRQYYAYILSAESAWNGGYAKLKDVPFIFDRKFVSLWTKDDFSPYIKSGKSALLLDLDKAANVSLTEKWLGMSASNAIGNIQKTQSNNVAFRFAVNNSKAINKAVLFNGKLNPPGNWPNKIVIDINQKLNCLVFAQAASFEDKANQEIAKYVITYNDGTTYTIPLRYGKNIFWYSHKINKQIWDNHNNPLLWTGKNAADEDIAIRYMKVDNPSPNKIISKLTVESANKEAALILFGLLGLTK